MSRSINMPRATVDAPISPSTWLWVGAADAIAARRVCASVSNAHPTAATRIAAPFP